MSQSITPRQREVMEFIRTFTKEHGFSPSQPEIAKAIGVANQSGVQGHLNKLEARGWIVRLRTPSGRAAARGIKITREIKTEEVHKAEEITLN